MEREAALWFLESVNLFSILCPHKVKTLATRHTLISFNKGDFVYRVNDLSKNIYMIAEGRIKIFHYHDDGTEIISAILTNGEIFGELGIAGEERRRDFAQAIDKTVICPLGIDDLKKLMKENKELSFSILKLVGLRLLKLERKLELLVFKDARTRIIEFLKDAASWKGSRTDSGVIISTRLTHKDIGALTGTSRQTVTVILNELKNKNIIQFDRKQILIPDIENLK
jgi:CRP/FNR family transcriptional regulator, cyclic AMP receptor protein